MDGENLRSGSDGPTRGGDGDLNVVTYRFPDSALGALGAVEGTSVGQTSSWSEFLELALEAAEQGRPLLLLAPDRAEAGTGLGAGDAARLDRLAVMLVRQVLKQVHGSAKGAGSAPATARGAAQMAGQPTGQPARQAAADQGGQRSEVLANLLAQAEVRRRLQPDLSPYDESWDFMMALAQGGLQGRVPSVSGLCRQVGCPLATGQRRVERLEELGLIQRSQDPDNLRRHRVELTDRGRGLIDAYVDNLSAAA